jgi:hypothetical protein
MERLGSSNLIEPLDRKAVISPFMRDSGELLDPPPNPQSESLVTFKQPPGNIPVQDELLRIIRAPGKIGPGGVILLWTAQVRK